MDSSKRQFVGFLITILTALSNWLRAWAQMPDEQPVIGLQYDAHIARLVGLDAAVMLATFGRWIAHNRVKHGTDECYQSAAWWCTEQFDWMNERQFRYQLDKLKKANLIEVSSGKGRDRRVRIRILANQNCQMDVTNLVLSDFSGRKVSHPTQKLSDDSNILNKESNSKIAGGAASDEPTQDDLLAEGVEDRDTSTPPPALSADVRAFYATVSDPDLAELPAGAWEWGKYRAETGQGIKSKVGFARSVAAKWAGEVVPKPTAFVAPVVDFTVDTTRYDASDDDNAPKWFDVACHQLEAQFDAATFAMLMRWMRFVEMDGNTAVIESRSGIARDMLQGRYYRDVRRAFRDAVGLDIELRFVVGERVEAVA